MKFNEGSKSPKCPLCSEQHWLSRCDSFKTKTVDERVKFTRGKGLCDNCLHTGHMAKFCPKESFCKIENCKLTRKHSTFLHPKDDQPNKAKAHNCENSTSAGSQNTAKSSCISSQALCNSTGAGDSVTGLPVVPVKVRSKGTDRIIETYAFLDPGSNTTFCTERLINRLGISGKSTTLSLTTMNSDNVMSESQLVSLEVYDLNRKNVIELPKAYSCTKLPVTAKDVPLQSDVDRWPHLKDIQLPCIDSDVDLLIGNDVPKALEPKQVRESHDDGPYAIKTLLGWTLNGPLGRKGTQARTTNLIHSDVQLNEQFERYCEIEFQDTKRHDETAMSQEDIKALSIMEESAKMKDGHYEIALPWRAYPPELPNNKVAAERRLSLLKKRLTKDPLLHGKYSAFMEDLQKKG